MPSRRLSRARALLCAAATAVLGVAHAAGTPWWQNAFIMEIYPRSYADSNGDGIGDINGITSHLDDLRMLGVDAIWITPMYPSPQVDFGYDIADYQAIDPQYGTVADFDHLLAEAKKRHIRVIMDMVANHTSDRHPWFLESASSRDNPRADWYVWNDGVDIDGPGITAFQKRYAHGRKAPPNNWQSVFGGSAWAWSDARQQFYYHRFYPQQPDLNWRNPDVEKAMFGAVRFWFDRGVDGFRLDAISTLFEDTQLRNDPERPGMTAYGDHNLHWQYSDNLPEVHDVMRRMRKLADSYAEPRLLVGETYTGTTAELDAWYGGAARDELQLPMDMVPGFGWQHAFDARWFRKHLADAQTQLHGTPLIAIDNHDNPRSIDRFGDGRHDLARARVMAALLLTQRAVAMSYYGVPIGMTTTEPKRKEDVRDPVGKVGWPKDKGRDGERTPMQWTPGPQAGFSTNPDTWLSVAPNWKTVNVQTELAQPGSLLNWYRQLIALRRNHATLATGAMTFIDNDNPHVLSYVREGSPRVLVTLNFSGTAQPLRLGLEASSIHTLAASDATLQSATTLDGTRLPPYTAWIVELRP